MTLIHEPRSAVRLPLAKKVAFTSTDEEVQEKSKVFALETNRSLLFLCRILLLRKYCLPPPFKTRIPVKDENVVSSPSEAGDDGVELSNFFEDQFQGLDGLSEFSTHAFPTVFMSNAAAQNISSAMPPFSLVMEDHEGKYQWRLSEM